MTTPATPKQPQHTPPEPQPPTNPDSTPQEPAKKRQDELLDEAVEETFPASDPISPKHVT